MARRAGCSSIPLSRRTRILAGLGLAALLAGCGGSGNDAVGKLTVYPVKGSVILPDGKPLTGGKVVFVAKKGELSFQGAVQSDGSFALSAGGTGDGAEAGEYKVRIEAEGAPTTAGKRKALPFAMKYLDEDASGLTATVKAGPNQLEPFKLERYGPPKASTRRIAD